jgi:hypothetical protein
LMRIDAAHPQHVAHEVSVDRRQRNIVEGQQTEWQHVEAGADIDAPQLAKGPIVKSDDRSGEAPGRGRRTTAGQRNSLADKLTVEAKALADLKIEKAAVGGERRMVEATLVR